MFPFYVVDDCAIVDNLIEITVGVNLVDNISLKAEYIV